ncbi:MAG: 1-(5-phosphoribosyl)-5-[(5-phosphoribosylamino)methylideneamino]imidazole-4-carboxamide isomerase [Rickettsiales bacterium]|nr:1-(5-phosphoribosyl)-5-[(5-phosphoribosylamino)methylideneamino]imidazole-4-carboxamide isomerase [Rickettsiales bacterium]
MNLYPAIDLKDGACVRLLRGDMDKATVFGQNPAQQAMEFQTAGFRWLHLVDLNGAFKGAPVNAAAVKAILKAVTIPVQLGGGIRTITHIEDWLEAGISRVILGTIALRDPAFVKDACKRFPNQIAVGIDAKNGRVAVEGWAQESDVQALTLARQFEDAGVAAIIYTDIARDGAMQGPNLAETVALAEAISTPVILSGGITRLEDLVAARAYTGIGLDGVIIGRALYEGTINATDALKVAA